MPSASPTPLVARSFRGRVLAHWPLLPSLALFSASLASALRAALRLTDGHLVYALDDAYIHMAVARNLATHGVWGCTPFHFSSSSSSLLWTFGLGASFWALGVHDWVPLVLNVVLAVATLGVAHAALARLGVPALTRAVALVGVVVAFPLAGMVLIGMEHILHLLLTIAFAAVAVSTLTEPPESVDRSRHRTLALCLLGALLGASRYEGFFVIGLACLALLVRRQTGRALAVGASSALPVAVFGAISVAHGWYVLPNPLMVKAVNDTAPLVKVLLKPFGSEDLGFLRNDRAMPILLALGVLGAAAHALMRRGAWRPPLLFPLLLAGMILLHGHYVFSPLYWAYRYDAYLVGFGILAAAVALGGLPSPPALPRGALSALLVAALVPVLADVREGVFPAAETEEMQGVYLEQYQTAQLIRHNYPHAAVIVNDLGAVTYYSEARILDLVGLGDIEPLVIMRNGPYTRDEVTEWTAPYRPSIAVVSLGWSVAVPLIPHSWLRVAVVRIPPHGHRVGYFAVDPDEGWALRERVARQFEPLRARGVSVHLRRPESMAADVAAR